MRDAIVDTTDIEAIQMRLSLLEGRMMHFESQKLIKNNENACTY